MPDPSHPDPNRTLPFSDAGEGVGTLSAPPGTPVVRSGSAGSPASSASRYDLTQEIARGGMGAVFTARDTTLNRTVAIKVLLDRHADNAVLAARFLE